jgi:hypothetical protein
VDGHVQLILNLRGRFFGLSPWRIIEFWYDNLSGWLLVVLWVADLILIFLSTTFKQKYSRGSGDLLPTLCAVTQRDVMEVVVVVDCVHLGTVQIYPDLIVAVDIFELVICSVSHFELYTTHYE